jgi:hypothetical protein
MMERRHLQEAIQTARRGDRGAAFHLVRQAILDDPSYAPAWFWMSRLVDDTGRQRECLERALALDPDYKQARDELENLRIRELLASARTIRVSEVRQEPPKIGAYLVERGFITAAQLEDALAEQRSSRKRSGRILLGDILIRRGWLTPRTLASALVIQQQDKIRSYDGGQPERLGEYLVVEGLITPGQLEAVLAEQAGLRQNGRHVVLGEILTRRGYLSREALERALDLQRQDFYGCFTD